jgi:hypothetical protein
VTADDRARLGKRFGHLLMRQYTGFVKKAVTFATAQLLVSRRERTVLLLYYTPRDAPVYNAELRWHLAHAAYVMIRLARQLPRSHGKVVATGRFTVGFTTLRRAVDLEMLSAQSLQEADLPALIIGATPTETRRRSSSIVRLQLAAEEAKLIVSLMTRQQQ